MKIYTKTGDTGLTGLIGGQRVLKTHSRIEAYGTMDEVISYIGLVADMSISLEERDVLVWVQDRLMTVSAQLAAPEKAILETLPSLLQDDIQLLEKSIDRLEALVPPLMSFILPGGHPLVSHCHIARTICRRGERSVLQLAHDNDIPVLILPFLNRLSDYLFVLARFFAFELKIQEKPWLPKE